MSLLENQTVAVLGGTGPQGRGLARRFAAAGVTVVLGSRAADRAQATAAELAEATGGPITGAANADAAAAGDIVIVAVPWDGHKELLTELAPALAGKIVVDCVNPMGFDKQGAYALPVEEGSAAQQAAAILPDSRVVAAFHHVSAVLLEDPEVDLPRHRRAGARRRPRRHRRGPRTCRHHPRHARHLRRPAAQRPPGRGADLQPDQHQPPLQGPLRPAHHRRLTGRGHVGPGVPASS